MIRRVVSSRPSSPLSLHKSKLNTFRIPLDSFTLTPTLTHVSVYSRCCVRICSAMVGVHFRPLLPSLPRTQHKTRLKNKRATRRISWRTPSEPGKVRKFGFGGPAHFTETCSGSEAGSYLRLMDFCITLLEAQGPSAPYNESKEKE